MSASNPKASPKASPPPLFPQLAKVEAAISGLVDRLDGGRMSLRDVNTATLSIVRLQKIRDGLRSEAVTLPLSAAPMSRRELAALQQLSLAASYLAWPALEGALTRAAENADRITRHKGTSERWMMHLQAAIMIKAGALSNPAIRASTGSHRSLVSIKAWLHAAEVVNG